MVNCQQHSNQCIGIEGEEYPGRRVTESRVAEKRCFEPRRKSPRSCGLNLDGQTSVQASVGLAGISLRYQGWSIKPAGPPGSAAYFLRLPSRGGSEVGWYHESLTLVPNGKLGVGSFLLPSVAVVSNAEEGNRWRLIAST